MYGTKYASKNLSWVSLLPSWHPPHKQKYRLHTSCVILKCDTRQKQHDVQTAIFLVREASWIICLHQSDFFHYQADEALDVPHCLLLLQWQHWSRLRTEVMDTMALKGKAQWQIAKHTRKKNHTNKKKTQRKENHKKKKSTRKRIAHKKKTQGKFTQGKK